MISLRPYKLSDKNFICSSFINSTYHNSIDRSVRICNKLTWASGMDKTINLSLESFDCIIAVPTDDQDLILGYALYKDNVLLYVYVKELFRKQGISKLLLKSIINKDFIQVLFTSKQMNHVTKQLKQWEYNPFI